MSSRVDLIGLPEERQSLGVIVLAAHNLAQNGLQLFPCDRL
jgi:hypothetical protein